MNRSRPKQIVIRMSEKEFEKVKNQIEKSGMKQQDYLIKCITKKKITNTDGLKKIIPEIKRIGVNINQIAKRINQGDKIIFNEIEIIRKELSEVWQLLKQLAQGRV